MALRGVFNQPFINLDPLLNISQYESLINEMLVGISKSWVDKGVVSCGSRDEEDKLELCQVLRRPQDYLNSEQVATLMSLTSVHQKAWYCSFLLPIHHPYSLVFIRREKDFWKKHLSQECDWTENSIHFPKTCDFIKTLPFEQIGRILFFISEPNEKTLIHYDGAHPESRFNSNTEMIYFRPMLQKKLFIWDEEKKQKYPVQGQASYWNDLDWHGVDASDRKTVSLRIDGVFTEEFREKLKIKKS